MLQGKHYIGDGVYAEFDGYGIVLTTEDGISMTNRIVLEPSVYSALADYVSALTKSADDQPPLGDCASCDGYVLDPTQSPYCPTCFREQSTKETK